MILKFILILLIGTLFNLVTSFIPTTGLVNKYYGCFVNQSLGKKLDFPTSTKTRSLVLYMAQISQKEAQMGIDKVVKVLQKDKRACDELGKLVKVTNVLGFGSPKPDIIAVRFNAQFQKGGMGRQAVPMPFGLGQTNKSEGRGVMVGQVKASVDVKSGKVQSCSVFRDLGYGRSFDLKC